VVSYSRGGAELTPVATTGTDLFQDLSVSDSFVISHQLTKFFGDFRALSNCSLSVKKGEVFGLLGPNGAGKSTWIRLLMGFLNPTSGSASIGGFDCHRQRDAVHRLVSYLPGDARLFRMMRGRRLLSLFAALRETDPAAVASTRERGIKLAELLELDLSRWVGLMSTGMRQKLALVTCFMADTPLMILDEPTANLDPTVRGRVIELVDQAREAGRTVIFSSHVLSEIEEVCDRVAILRAGELVHSAPMSEIKLQHRIRARLSGPMPAIPDALQSLVSIVHLGDHVQIDAPTELSSVLKWLSEAPLLGMQVQPIGLRSVYDRFHGNGALVGDFSEAATANRGALP
jgi:ABC-2 type transport system ATP-binding protein